MGCGVLAACGNFGIVTVKTELSLMSRTFARKCGFVFHGGSYLAKQSAVETFRETGTRVVDYCSCFRLTEYQSLPFILAVLKSNQLFMNWPVRRIPP